MPSKISGVGFGLTMATEMFWSASSLTAEGDPIIAMISPRASARRALVSEELNMATWSRILPRNSMPGFTLSIEPPFSSEAIRMVRPG